MAESMAVPLAYLFNKLGFTRSMKQKLLTIWLDEEQIRLLDERAKKAGFQSRSDYIRFILLDTSIFGKIDTIYRRVVNDETI